MSSTTRHLGGHDYGTGIPPIDQRTAPPRPSVRPAPTRGAMEAAEPFPAIAATPGEFSADVDDGAIALSRTYRAYDTEVSRIKLRRPLARDIKQHGNPLKLTTGPDGRVAEIEVRWDAVAAYVSALASPPLPPSTVDEFEFIDLDACAAVIARFFVTFR
ncbi:MAG: phage tail assembly protein [Hyphomicrobiaceae bacterium]|nr:phage tail assembly protein [Hyphomicrobiaceae bacterium]